VGLTILSGYDYQRMSSSPPLPSQKHKAQKQGVVVSQSSRRFAFPTVNDE